MQVWTVQLLHYTTQEHSFAAFAALIYNTQECLQPSNTGRKSSVMRYHALALQRLYRHLDHCSMPDDSTLLCIMFLAILSIRLGDDVQLAVHRKALQDLVQIRGGLHQITDSYVRSWLSQYMDLWKLLDGRIGPERNASSRINIRRPPQRLINQLPSGFQPIIERHHLSPTVIDTLVRTQTLIRRHNHSAITESEQPVDSGMGMLLDACNQLQPAKYEEPSIDYLLLLGLVLFNFFAHSNLAPWLLTRLRHDIGDWVRKELTDRILDCVEVRSCEVERCLSWLASMTIGAWQSDRGKLLPEGQVVAVFAKSRFISLARVQAKEFFPMEQLGFYFGTDPS